MWDNLAITAAIGLALLMSINLYLIFKLPDFNEDDND